MRSDRSEANVTRARRVDTHDKPMVAARDGRSSSFVPTFVWWVVAAFAVLLVTWTVMTPAFRAPDESQHVNSVLRLAQGGGWPAPGDARMLPEVLRARTVSGFTNKDSQTGNWNGGDMLPGFARANPQLDLRYFALFSRRSPPPTAERLPFDQLAPAGRLSQQPDQMTQHPPLYYAVESAIYRVLGADDWRFDRALELMRLVSVVMVMWTPLMCWLTARRLTGSVRVSKAASLLPLAIPQLADIGSSVTNDALAIGIGGLGVTMIAYLLTGASSWRFLGALGVVLGAACLTKATLLPVVVTAFLGLAVVSFRGRRSAVSPLRATALKAAVLGALTLAFGGWWYVVDLVRYGTPIPAGYELVNLGVDAPRLTLTAFASAFIRKVAASFWGSFGYLEIPLASAVVIPATIITTIAVVLSLVKDKARGNILVLLSLPGLSVANLFFTAYRAHVRTGILPGLQGRYLFVGLVPLAVAGTVGINSLCDRRAMVGRWFLLGSAVCAIGMSMYGLSVAFNGFWVDGDMSFLAALNRMAAFSPWPTWFVVALLFTFVAVCVAVLMTTRPTTSVSETDRRTRRNGGAVGTAEQAAGR